MMRTREKAPTVSDYSELERLSALETLKGLVQPEQVRLMELVEYLRERGLWEQFSKITIGDLQGAFAATEAPRRARKKQRILEDELGDDDATASAKGAEPSGPQDGGLSTDEVARQVLPFVEGNGEVAFDDIADYTQIDRKVLRHHLGVLVKQGRLERLGVGRQAIYSTLG